MQKTVICFVNKTNDRAIVMLACSDDLNLDIPKILKETLTKFNGKGGGRERFAQGSADSKFIDKIIPEIKKHQLIF